MRRRLLIGLCAAIVTACVIYTGQPKADPRVIAGRGLTGRIYFNSTSFHTAELLWGDSTGYLILLPGDSGHVMWAPAERVREVWFPVTGLVRTKPTTPEQLEALRSASRFPFGANPQAIELIMTPRGQRFVDTLQASGPTTTTTSPFLEAARAGTSKYRSVDAAVADGFKPVGTEFPFMGEHWVNLPRVLGNTFDASQPSVLIYVNGAKGKELAGVGYTALLGPGERPPESPAPEDAWHEHNGSVIDESLPGLHESGHDGGHTGGHTSGQKGGHDGGLRLAVMHAWIWTENPAGVFVTDNHALPFVRQGAAPRAMSVEALRGLTLAQDSAGYYLQTLRTALQMTDAEERQLTHAVTEIRSLAASGDEQLAVSWDRLWKTLERDLSHRSADLSRARAALER